MSEAAAEDPREEAAARAFRVDQRLRMVAGDGERFRLILACADACEGCEACTVPRRFLPEDRPDPESRTGDWLILRGRRYAVVNSWKDVESKDGRCRWGIVTDENIV